MNWQEIFAILVPTIGFMGWFYSRIDKRFDILEKRLDGLSLEISAIKDRLSRLEGRFDERGYWASRKSNGTEDN